MRSRTILEGGESNGPPRPPASYCVRTRTRDESESMGIPVRDAAPFLDFHPVEPRARAVGSSLSSIHIRLVRI